MSTIYHLGGVGRGTPVKQVAPSAPGGGGFGGSGTTSNWFSGNSFGGSGFDSGESGFGSANNNADTGFGGSNFGSGGFSGGGNGSRGGQKTCNKCGEPGHFVRECPNATSGDAGFGGGGFNSGHNESGGGRGFGGGGRGGRRGESNACHKCGQSGHFARECTNSGGSSGFGGGGFDSANTEETGGGFGGGSTGFGGGRGGPRTCHKCNQPGHIARECTNVGGNGGGRFSGGFDSVYNDAEGGGGFSGARGFDSAGGDGDNQSSRPRNRGCYNCGGEGHVSKDCPEPRKERAEGGNRSNKCFRCNQEGHKSAECTNPPAEGAEGQQRKKVATHVPEEASVDNLWDQHIPTGINFEQYFDIPVEVTGNNVDQRTFMTAFEQAGLTPQLLENVKKANFTKPTPIQQFAMPHIVAGRDLMGCAQTGSGKTAAFLLPILTTLVNNEAMLATTPSERQDPVAIVMVPTRELAIQIKDEGRKFAAGTLVKVLVAYGGMSVKHQLEMIQQGCNILVATPGRLLALVTEGRIGLARCKYLVLDEADRMLDMGFEAEVRRLVSQSEMPPKTERQTLMFSATFPEGVQTLAAEFLNDHVFVTIGKVGAANRDIIQEVMLVDQASKKDKLIEMVTADMASFKNDDGTYSKKVLVFVERKRMADLVGLNLSEEGVPATSIHGDREQRERELALNDFKTGRCPVLVATAVAARGLDIKGVDHVINYDLPQAIDDYVHRIGRTGRVGNPGRATSYYDPDKDDPIAVDLVKVLADAQQEVPEWLQERASGGGTTAAAFETDTGAVFGATTDYSAPKESEW